MREGGVEGERRDTDVGKGSLLEKKRKSEAKRAFYDHQKPNVVHFCHSDGIFFGLEHLDIFLSNTT